MASGEKVIETLNELIAVCLDGESGYLTATEGVKTPALKELFESYTKQRALFAAELRSTVQELGGKPAESGSLTGKLQRGWHNIKSLILKQDESAIIGACEESEKLAYQAYEEALKTSLPVDVKSTLVRQFDQMKEASARVHALMEVCAK